MSFSSDVKNELARTEPESGCCQLAEISGFLRVASSISVSGGGKIGFTAQTGDNAIARHFKRLLSLYFNDSIDLSVGVVESELFGKNKKYILLAEGKTAGEEIMRETGLLMVNKGRNYFTDGIFDNLVRSECCKQSYIRGMFLGTGSVTDPNKGYHLEFLCNTEKLAQDLKALIFDLAGIEAKITKRRSKFGVYLKSASDIGDLLGYMGAYAGSLKLQDIAVQKSVKGKVTTMTNCDSANMDRTVSAASDQINAINILKERGTYRSLTPKQKELAELRLQHPEMSLTELGEMLNPPIKKSGVNNRFKRIFELARS